LDGEPDAVLAGSFIEVVDASGRTMGIKEAWRTLPPWTPPTSGPFLSGLGDPRLALLETNWLSTTSNMAFRTSLVRDHGLRFAPLRYAHDWDFALSASHLGRIELIERPLIRYRAHGANTIGEGADEAIGAMRFEILWVVSRHAGRLLRDIAASSTELRQLRELLYSSAPTFGRDEIFDQLLTLRGLDPQPPAAHDALLDPEHSFRRAAVEALARAV
jgi:hypothetical protein